MLQVLPEGGDSRTGGSVGINASKMASKMMASQGSGGVRRWVGTHLRAGQERCSGQSCCPTHAVHQGRGADQ